jgi:hypothetical protein
VGDVTTTATRTSSSRTGDGTVSVLLNEHSKVRTSDRRPRCSRFRLHAESVARARSSTHVPTAGPRLEISTRRAAVRTPRTDLGPEGTAVVGWNHAAETVRPDSTSRSVRTEYEDAELHTR